MYAELESPPVPTADDRSLQMALELSSLGLLGSTADDSSSSASYDEASKSKKSQNMTECVPVPSSEHVAEIVGRQGCKIKALRAKTSTYIKTPVRGEEPVFVVTGRKEDVAMARREIQSAAEHFTQIRATRNKASMHSNVTPMSGLAFPMQLASGNTSPDLTSPGTITLQVRVPYRVVGLVVGPKGATIKRIQSQTHTYIVTPSRDKEPVFEVTGLPENVEKAKEEIEAHIAARTGSQSRDIDDDFASNGTVVGSPASFSRAQTNYACRPPVLNTRPELFSLSHLDSPFFNQFSGYQKYPQTNQTTSLLDMTPNAGLGVFGQHNRTGVEHYEVNTDSITSPTLGYDAATSVSWPNKDLPEMHSFLYSGGNDTSTNVSSLSHQASLASSIRLSPTFSDDFSIPPLGMQPPLSHPMRPPVHRVGSDSLDSTGSSLDLGQPFTKQSNGINIESGYSSSSQTDSLTSGSPVDNVCFGGSRSASPPRVCIICKESAVMAALVPCGHNHFCFECADKTAKNSAPCPCCNRPATFALLIKT